MLSEVAQDVRVNERRGGGGDEHLPAVAAGRDSRRSVHVDPDVALLGHVRRAGVDADAHQDRPRGKSLPRDRGCLQRTRRCWEGDEEGVPLGVDFDAALGAEGLAEDAAMLTERLGIGSSAKLLQELGRALHVGKEEGDGSGREFAHPSAMMRRVEAFV